MRARWMLVAALVSGIGCGVEDVPGDGSVRRDASSDSISSDGTGSDGTSNRDVFPGTDVQLGNDVQGRDANPGTDVPTGIADIDGDGISDADEGAAMGVDTDMDGTPDSQDADSDNDGIPDSVEAGDPDPVTPPLDSDRDGTPDFRDLDSDNNTWTDAQEGTDDVNGDGQPNYRDPDNDGDLINDDREFGPGGTPFDTDGDGIVDSNDLDSDGDTISDLWDGTVDTNRDGSPDFRDLDSDGDGYFDRDEDGDMDIATPPVDTDGDGIRDFRDLDSDNDGLPDRLERTNGTSRTNPDTDGDGVSDLIEVGAGTRATDPTDNPRTRGNFVFVVPYMQPPSPARDTLQFATTLRRADVYFLMDTTGSMSGEITNLRNGINATLIPDIRTRIPEAWMGVGRYDDYPVDPFGSPGDLPFRNLQNITMDDAAVRTGVNALALGSGNDGPESGLQAIYAVITGMGLSWPGGSVGAGGACASGRFGYPCFRPDAVPIIVNFTDAPFHNGPGGSEAYSFTAPVYTTVTSALTTRRARVITVFSCPGTDAYCNQGRSNARSIATDTGTVDAGSPLVYDIPADGSGLSTRVVDGIAAVARGALDVSARGRDLVDSGETVDAIAAFVDHLETRTTAAPGRTCTLTYPTQDRMGIDGDAFPDTFLGVRGDPVCFDIIAKNNTTVMPTANPQLFRAEIQVIGDGFTPLDTRVVYFLVPPNLQ